MLHPENEEEHERLLEELHRERFESAWWKRRAQEQARRNELAKEEGEMDG